MPTSSSTGFATNNERVTLKMSLIALTLVWVGVVLFLLLSAQNQGQTYREYVFEEVSQRTQLLALMQSELLDSKLTQYDLTLQTLRDRYTASGYSAADLEASMLEELARLSEVSDFLMIDPQGDVISWTQPDQRRPNLFDRDYFRAHLDTQTDLPFLSLPGVARIDSAVPFVGLSRPVFSDDGEWLGVMAAALHLQTLAQNLDAFTVNAHISSTISHRNGHLLLGIPYQQHPVGTLLPQTLLETNAGTKPQLTEDDEMVAVQQLPRWNLVVHLREDITPARERIEAFTQQQQQQHAIIGVGLSFLLLLLGWLLYRRLHAITLIRASEGELQASHVRNQAIVSALPDLLITVSADGDILDFESGEEQSLPLNQQDHLGANIRDSLPAPLVEKAQRYITHTLETHRVQSFEFQLKLGRKQRYFEARTSRLDNHRVLMIILDISERKSAQNELQWRATHDNLTGLPNRVLFYDRLQQAFARRMRQKQSFTLLYLDLNGFKKINDTLGHTAGDLLLKLVAQRLSNRVRGTDTVARLAGDEFAIIFNNCSRHIATKLAQELAYDIARPYRIEGSEAVISTSIGIAVCPEDGHEADTLVRVADSAMYEAKNRATIGR